MRLDLQLDAHEARGRYRRQLKRYYQGIHVAVSYRTSTANEVTPGCVRAIRLEHEPFAASFQSETSAIIVAQILEARVLCGQSRFEGVTYICVCAVQVEHRLATGFGQKLKRFARC